LLGVAFAATGFSLAAPVGVPTSSVFSEPRVEFAPAIFILGVVFAFLSAVAYELIPDGERPPDR
jgi:predicted MFS family arabinose efflux permease